MQRDLMLMRQFQQAGSPVIDLVTSVSPYTGPKILKTKRVHRSSSRAGRGLCGLSLAQLNLKKLSGLCEIEHLVLCFELLRGWTSLGVKGQDAGFIHKGPGIEMSVSGALMVKAGPGSSQAIMIHDFLFTWPHSSQAHLHNY